MIKNKALAFLAIILLLPILACKILGTERTPPATVLPGIPGATAQPPSIATAVTAVIATPTQPTQAEKLNVVSTWFYQDKQIKSSVDYAFFVENPNPNLALANLQFQVVAYDASETILGTGTVDIGMIFPGERLAVSSPLNVPESSTVTSIGVQISRSAEAQISEQRGSPFTTEKVTYFSSQAYSRVTGVIRNNLNADISYLAVTAIAYDESGNIIGAGESGLDGLPANGYNAAVIDLQIVGEPAKVELYPFLTNINAIEEPSQTIEALRVVAVGASQDQYTQASWGMIIENTDTKAPAHGEYTLIAYDENGAVLVTMTGFIGLIFPGERLGVSGYLFLPEETQLGKVEARIYSWGAVNYDSWGILEAGIITNPLTAEQATYLQDDGKVTGIIKNLYGKDLQNIQVTAIAYDASGAIIGGWSTYVSSVPANGQVAFEIWVNLTETPAVIELYPTLTSPQQ